MKISELIQKEKLEKLPISFQYLKPIDLNKAKFINKYARIYKYKSLNCSIYPPMKPISKII